MPDPNYTQRGSLNFRIFHPSCINNKQLVRTNGTKSRVDTVFKPAEQWLTNVHTGTTDLGLRTSMHVGTASKEPNSQRLMAVHDDIAKRDIASPSRSSINQSSWSELRPHVQRTPKSTHPHEHLKP